MSQYIRTEISVDAADTCLIAEASTEVETPINEITWSSVTDRDGTFVEEFTLEGDTTIGRNDVEEVFESDSHTIYQFTRDPEGDCICVAIEEFGCPVSSVQARDGTLYISFHARDVETIQDIVKALQDTYPNVHVRHLAQTNDREDTDFVFVDREQLTQKQREVLETAHEMGYFEHPRTANASEVAETLGIALPTFTEHLAAAQRKLLDSILRS